MSHDLALFAPEALALAAALALFIAVLVGARARTTWWLGLGLSWVVLVATALTLRLHGDPFAAGIYRVDLFSQFLKIALALGLTLVMLLGSDLPGVRDDARGEVPIFLFLATAAMMMLVSATELLTFYVALELSAYSLYTLVALGRPTRTGTEAATKYILFGAVASAITLYGISLVFGVAGSTFLATIAHLPSAALTSPLFVVGVLMILAGLFFKLALFPFHAWAPDVYQGAPSTVVTFVATVSKVAAVGILLRACTLIWTHPGRLPEALMVLAVAAMTFGNIAALVQKDLKRLLAYSAIAHAGYILVGVEAWSTTGAASALFYAVVYLIMGFCPFLVIVVLSSQDRMGGGENPTLESLHGLWRRSPLLSLVLMVGMFGLAGIPPTPGFAGKWFLFAAALGRGHFWLVLIAAVNATISLYYYLQVVRAAYVAPPDDPEPLTLGRTQTLAAGLVLALVFYAGIFPGSLWRLAHGAAAALLGG